MSARDELAQVIVAAYGEDAETECPCAQDLDVADAILADGYRKPQALGYVVLSRDGRIIGEGFSERAAAQARADEWTNDCKTGGVDWDYRVAEIVEAAA